MKGHVSCVEGRVAGSYPGLRERRPRSANLSRPALGLHRLWGSCPPRARSRTGFSFLTQSRGRTQRLCTPMGRLRAANRQPPQEAWDSTKALHHLQPASDIPGGKVCLAEEMQRQSASAATAIRRRPFVHRSRRLRRSAGFLAIQFPRFAGLIFP